MLRLIVGLLLSAYASLQGTVSSANEFTPVLVRATEACIGFIERNKDPLVRPDWEAVHVAPGPTEGSGTARIVNTDFPVLVKITRNIQEEGNVAKVTLGEYRFCDITPQKIPKRVSDFGWKRGIDLPKIWEDARQATAEEQIEAIKNVAQLLLNTGFSEKNGKVIDLNEPDALELISCGDAFPVHAFINPGSHESGDASRWHINFAQLNNDELRPKACGG